MSELIEGEATVSVPLTLEESGVLIQAIVAAGLLVDIPGPLLGSPMPVAMAYRMRALHKKLSDANDTLMRKK